MRQALPYCLIIATLLGSRVVLAQLGSNLIPNHSLEELRFPDSEFPCPSSGGSISLTNDWSSAFGSVDYFNACSNEDWPNYGVPQNLNGWQHAYDGLAYALIAGYVDYEGYDDAREFLWMELPDTLKAGQGYYWQAHVSLADSMNFAMSRLGVLFSQENTRYRQKDDFFIAEPQVENPIDSLLSDKENWKKVSGNFIATGGEKYMTIGFFRRDVDENIVRVGNNPQGFYAWDVSAYYIDAVELREDNSIGIGEPERYTIELYPNPTEGQVNMNYQFESAAHLHWEITDMAGRAVHAQPLQGNWGRATLGQHLPQGVYISTVIADGVRIHSSRLVVL